jgi:hypothetical protein
MAFLTPKLPPYDPVEWARQPFQERARRVCETWALQGYGTPGVIYLLYLGKIALYVLGWIGCCSFSPSLGGLGSIADWWLEPLAFQKAILWSLCFEVLGLGCGSGPLTGRQWPPIGGFLFFLRPGTTKLALFPGWPIVGGAKRTWFEVTLYAALLLAGLRGLTAPSLEFGHWLPIVVLLPILGLADKTVFLCARAEHYWVCICCFAFAQPWLAAAKAVQLALWFWAGVSKLNHHFPTVVCAMTSNSPYLRSPALLRRLYRDYPTDLRPSQLATWLAHAGTALEFAVPLAFLLTPLGEPPVVAIVLMLLLHGHITSSVPLGVPLEWNFMVVYSGFALFWAHPELSLASIGPLGVVIFLGFMLVALPLFGNLKPSRLSFLLSMRYYAGNWPVSVWLFRGESYRKLERVHGASPWISDQLLQSYDEPTVRALLSMGMGFRLMHLHGRALTLLAGRAVDDLEQYQWIDGEIIAGMSVGWNFGDGHLHQEQLLGLLQASCGFEPGELRCIFLESEPLGAGTLAYRIADACSGELERGELAIAPLRERQPWWIGPAPGQQP